MILKLLAPFVVAYVVSVAICFAWRAILDEWPDVVASIILVGGIAAVVAYNWPKKWRVW